jgi:multiple sugar transport system substrate-binding protein
LFDRAGVPYPTETWTWDDFLTKATRLTNRSTASGVPVFGAMEQFLVVNDSPSYSITRAFGGEWFSADWSRSTVDSAATVEAIQFTADWRNRHRIVPLPDEVSGNAFNNGQAAMRIDFARGVDTLKQLAVPFRFDLVPLPRGKAGAFPCATGSGQSLVKEAKSPDAGWLLVKFLGGSDAQRLAIEFDGTSRVDLLETTMPKDGVPKGFRTSFVDPLQQTSKTKAVAIPTPPRAVDIEQLYRKEFEPVRLGQKTAREVATALKPQFDDILKAAGTR